MKSKIVKTFILGMCITAFSTFPVLADSGDGQSAVIESQQIVNNSNYEKQKEIDKYLFETHKNDIAKKDFKIIHTVTVDNLVEIGITPYSEENAKYLYDLFGKDTIKVVEGQQAVIMNVDTAPDIKILATAEINEDILKIQREIDEYLFETHKDEIDKKDFKVTYTSPNDNFVEIGITPYNEENANYVYSIFGKDKIKVVEGQKAELMAVDSVSEKVKDETGKTLPISVILAFIAGAALTLGSAVIIKNKK